MCKADVFTHDRHASVLEEIKPRTAFRFTYDEACNGPRISVAVSCQCSKNKKEKGQ